MCVRGVNSEVIAEESISMETSPALRALQAFAQYDSLRLSTYRDCEPAHARVLIEQAFGATLLYFDEVSYFNRIYALDEAIAGHLDHVEAFYGDSPFGCELVSVTGDKGPLAEACLKRGWLPSHRYAWLHVKTGEPEVNDEYPGISIRQPLPQERIAFLEFYLRGFEAPEAKFPAAIRNMRHLFELPQLHFLIASREGRDAAIGMLCVFGETALLAAGATLPEERWHGCHHALIAARIRLARSLGCGEIVSFAYAGGQSHLNMESMGLRTVIVTQAWRFKGAVHS
jgi:GNAT superfamily N-acetyltransferase